MDVNKITTDALDRANPEPDDELFNYELIEEMITDTVNDPEHMAEILEASTEQELAGLAVALCNVMQNDRPSLNATYADRVRDQTDFLITKACIDAVNYENECNDNI